MSDAISPEDKATPVGSREWIKRIFTFVVVAVLVAACGSMASPAPSPSSDAAISTPEAASAAAIRLATISGPLTVGEIKHGTYADLWGGSTNDLSGQGTADTAAKAGLIVWRVDVAGPSGWQELYIDEATRVLLDTITQGT